MGILTALYTAVSGLNASGSSLSAIGNNIANTGTVGFKASRANFADVVSASLGGAAGASQVGIGVRLAGVKPNFTQGSLQTTNNALDMAVDGDGFFQVKDSAGGTFYTRAGQFNKDKDGKVVTPDGFFLQGYQADSSGKITVAGTPSDINLTTTTVPPTATTKVTSAANLNSDATATTFALSDPTGTSDFSTSITVYDSLGKSHLLTTYFTKTAANTWAYNVVGNSSEVTEGTTSGTYNTSNINSSLKIVRMNSGTLTFNTSGALLTESTVTRYDDGTAGGTVGSSAGVGSASFTGAASLQPVTFDFGSSITTDGGTGLDRTTQFGSTSALASQTQDGRASGILQSVTVKTDGTISGRFSNGLVQDVAQVALARFNNALGLTQAGKNLLVESGESGSPSTGAPDTEGRGRVLSSSLELSNVDLGEEFVSLISAQRGFQANARVVTTGDDMLGELVNLKR